MNKLFKKLTEKMEINSLRKQSYSLSEEELATVENKVIFKNVNEQTAELLEFRGSDGSISE